jgi:hypothetical protein
VIGGKNTLTGDANSVKGTINFVFGN